MKINQFAHTPANFETKLEELSKLRFIKAGAQQEDLNLLWKNLLLKCFPQAKCLAQKHEKLASLAATKTESVLNSSKKDCRSDRLLRCCHAAFAI